jgi:hypothetical protein
MPRSDGNWLLFVSFEKYVRAHLKPYPASAHEDGLYQIDRRKRRRTPLARTTEEGYAIFALVASVVVGVNTETYAFFASCEALKRDAASWSSGFAFSLTI